METRSDSWSLTSVWSEVALAAPSPLGGTLTLSLSLFFLKHNNQTKQICFAYLVRLFHFVLQLTQPDSKAAARMRPVDGFLNVRTCSCYLYSFFLEVY